MKELMVVAIGGNSIIKDNASQSVEHQAQAVKAVAESVLEMLASDYDIVLTHGNGPQVGLDLRRAEIAHEREGLPLTPLANCVADTQGPPTPLRETGGRDLFHLLYQFAHHVYLGGCELLSSDHHAAGEPAALLSNDGASFP